MKEEAVQAKKCSVCSTKGTCGLARCCVTCVRSPENTFSKVETFGHYKLKGLEPTFNGNKKNIRKESQEHKSLK